MSKVQYRKALKEAEKISTYSEDALYSELGLRIGDITNIGGYKRSINYTDDFFEVATDMGFKDDLRNFGRKWWRQLEPELMKMLCEEKNEDMKKLTSGKKVPEIAANLAVTAIIASMAPPAWVIVATTILAQKLAQSGLDALCKDWKE